MVGYDATLLPAVAEVYLKFRDVCAARGTGVPKQYAHIVTACDLVIRGLARVGIIALVDEATGFQYERPRRDLEEQLKRFLAEELVRFVFPYRKSGGDLLCGRTRDLVFRSVRPDGNRLEGYAPSSAVNRIMAELAA